MLNEKTLRAAAKELNDVLSLEPPFNVKAPLANLTQEIKETVDTPDLYSPGEFEFSEETQAVIDALRSNGKPKKAKKPVEEPEEEEPEEEAEASVKKLADKLAKAPVNAGKKPTRVVVDADPDDEEEDEPEEAPKKAPKAKKEPKEKVERGPSPYGSSVEIMCKDYTTSKESLLKQLAKKGIDVEAGKSGILTGFSVVQKIVSLLKKNGHINE